MCDSLGFGKNALEFIGRHRDYDNFIRNTIQHSEVVSCDLKEFNFEQNKIDCLPDSVIAGAECTESAEHISQVRTILTSYLNYSEKVLKNHPLKIYQSLIVLISGNYKYCFIHDFCKKIIDKEFR